MKGLMKESVKGCRGIDGRVGQVIDKRISDGIDDGDW